MRVLITGHKGFIGSHFWNHYREKNNRMLGIDIAGDYGIDARDFFRKSTDYYDIAIHCAAVVGGRKMIDGDPLAVAVDMSIDAEFFQWCMRTSPGRAVYFSSSAAYPVWMQKTFFNPLRERDIEFGGNTIGVPDMTYGWTKLSGEYQAQFVQQEGIPVHIFRPFSGYGAGQSLDYPFPSFIERAVCGADPFEIWGDGEQRRDFVHVDDIVATVLATMNQGFTEPLNIGTGVGTDFNTLADTVCRMMGYKPEKLHLRSNPVGVNCRVADITLLNSIRPPQISLEEGIARALKGD